MRRLLLLAALVAPLLYLRRRREAQVERVRLFFDDGSAVTLERGAPGSERLFALARQAL